MRIFCQTGAGLACWWGSFAEFPKQFLGFFILVFAVIQIYLASRVSRLSRSRTKESDALLEAEIRRLNKISRIIQVFALAVFIIFYSWGLKMSGTDMAITVVGGARGIYTAGDSVSVVSAGGQAIAGVVSAVAPTTALHFKLEITT